MNALYSRTALLVGGGGVEKLKAAHVTVIGVGGVGGYAAEMLVRAGVGSLTLADFDKVEESDKNRQIIATDLTVGREKVEAAAERFKTINADIKLRLINKRLNENTANEILTGQESFVIDAIDSVPDKVTLVLTAQKLNVPIISAMGAGRRLETPRFEIADIYKTSYDPLAKKMRFLLKQRGVKKLDVCYAKNLTVGAVIDRPYQIGSISYAPALCGVTIAAHVIQKLIS